MKEHHENGFQACERIFLLALLSIPNHYVLCCLGALGAIYVQYCCTNHFRHGCVHCLCLHPDPHSPGLGIFLKNMWISQYNFQLISFALCEMALHMYVAYNLLIYVTTMPSFTFWPKRHSSLCTYILPGVSDRCLSSFFCT